MPDGFEDFSCDAVATQEMVFCVKPCTDVIFGGTRLGRAGHFTYWSDDGVEHVVLETFNGSAIGCVSMDRDWACATFQIVMSADRVMVFRILSEIVFRTLLIRRGLGLVLHAAGISCNGRGLVLVGRSGTGKSIRPPRRRRSA